MEQERICRSLWSRYALGKDLGGICLELTDGEACKGTEQVCTTNGN